MSVACGLQGPVAPAVLLAAVFTALSGCRVTVTGDAPGMAPVDPSSPPYDRRAPEPAEVVADPPAFERTWDCAGVDECDVARIVAGGDDFLSTTGFTCVQLRGGQVVCWGHRREVDWDEVCTPATDTEARQCPPIAVGESIALPTAVPALAGTESLSARGNLLCGVRAGTLACWSADRAMAEVQLPPLPAALAAEVSDFRLGRNWGCGFGPRGAVECIAFSDWADAELALAPRGLQGALALSLGNQHGCALIESGRVRCWGANDSGQLGSGDFASSPDGVTLEGLEGITQIAAGASASCAVDSDGSVYCWGYIDSERPKVLETYEPGDWCDDGACKATAERIEGLPAIRQVVLGKEHACALSHGGEVFCWGSNRAGQLGDGTFERSQAPRRVAELPDATALAAGRLHNCALREDGSLSCWGDDQNGQLGVGRERAPFLCVSSFLGTGYRCANTPLPVVGLSP